MPPTPPRPWPAAPAEEGTHGSFRAAGEPTAVRLTFRADPDLVPGGVDRAAPGLAAGGVDRAAPGLAAGDIDGDIDFAAEVAARSLADGQCHPLATASGTAAAGRPVALELAGPPLPPGMHRLEARVSIYVHHHQPGDPPLAHHHALGDLVHVAACRARQPTAPGTYPARQPAP